MTQQYLVRFEKPRRDGTRQPLGEVTCSLGRDASRPTIEAWATRQALKQGIPCASNTLRTVLALRGVDPATGVKAWRQF